MAVMTGMHACMSSDNALGRHAATPRIRTVSLITLMMVGMPRVSHAVVRRGQCGQSSCGETWRILAG